MELLQSPSFVIEIKSWITRSYSFAEFCSIIGMVLSKVIDFTWENHLPLLYTVQRANGVIAFGFAVGASVAFWCDPRGAGQKRRVKNSYVLRSSKSYCVFRLVFLVEERKSETWSAWQRVGDPRRRFYWGNAAAADQRRLLAPRKEIA